MKRKQPKIDENDFDALDRFARNITPEMMRPLSPEMRRRWNEAKRGRPAKRPGMKSVPTLITVEPALLKKIDAYAKRVGISRSQLFAESVRQRLKKAG